MTNSPAIAPNAPCPCGGAKYKRCCAPLHRGAAAPDPSALMRSRYAAYALGLWEYIIATTDPAGSAWQTSRAAWLTELSSFTANTEFVGLRLVDAQTNGDHGHVMFHAQLLSAGRPTTLRERSRFTRVDGRWLYHSGVVASPP